MKYLEMGRVGGDRVMDLILAYVSVKLTGKEMRPGQKALIAYFNFLVNNDLRHVKDMGDHYIVSSRVHGSFALRKPFSSDLTVYQQVYRDEEYGLLAELAAKHLPPGEVHMIDGGANIGLASHFVQEKLKSSHQVSSVLVEPDDGNVEMIERNNVLRGAGLFSIDKAGLFNRVCYLDCVRDFRDNLEWSIRVVPTERPTDLRAVEILSIAGNKGWDVIDILKLDIEGAESHLFEDASYAEKFLSRVRLLAIELHDEFVDRTRVMALLDRAGFRMQASGELQIGWNSNLV